MGAKLRALHKTADLMNNEGGSVIIAALLVLVLLTISVIASTSVSNTEVQIAGHTVAYQQNFYRAEGAAMEAVGKLDEHLEAVPDALLYPPEWVEPEMDKISDQNIRDWDILSSVSEAEPEGSSLAPEETPDETQYFGVYTGIASGNTLHMGSSTIHSYKIYGRCSPRNRGAAVVQIGYKKAF